MIKLIGFDLDNTLWPVKPAILKAEAALTEYFKTLRPELNYPPVNIAALRAKVLEQHPDFSFRLTDLRRRILFEIAAQSPEHQVNASEIADAGMQVFLETRSQVTLYPGAEEALKHLAQRYTLCALTNGNAEVARLSIGRLFTFQLSAESVGSPKPNPDLFLAALERQQLTPEAMIYVGDDPELDVDAAAKLGIHTIWVNQTGFGDAETSDLTQASAAIDDLKDLPAAVAGIEAGLNNSIG